MAWWKKALRENGSKQGKKGQDGDSETRVGGLHYAIRGYEMKNLIEDETPYGSWGKTIWLFSSDNIFWRNLVRSNSLRLCYILCLCSSRTLNKAEE